MLKKLNFPLSGSVDDFTRVKKEMYNVLLTLNKSNGIYDDFSKEDLKLFVNKLVESQRRDLTEPCNCSWCIPENKDHMPSDARIDFIFEPTYIAVAILTYVKSSFHDVAISVEGFDDCLKNGMKFSTLRQLSGHGYASFESTLNAIRIFDLGRVPEYLSKNRSFNIDLYLLFQQIYHQVVSDLNHKNTKDLWSNDLSSGMKEIVEKLQYVG